MNDHDAMLAIHELLDGVEWGSQTLEDIAVIMEQAGYPIRDCNDVEPEDHQA